MYCLREFIYVMYICANATTEVTSCRYSVPSLRTSTAPLLPDLNIDLSRRCLTTERQGLMHDEFQVLSIAATC